MQQYRYTQMYSIKLHQVQILYNVIVTYVDLTLKINSTFINETVKVLQIQLNSSNTIKFSISKKS